MSYWLIPLLTHLSSRRTIPLTNEKKSIDKFSRLWVTWKGSRIYLSWGPKYSVIHGDKINIDKLEINIYKYVASHIRCFWFRVVLFHQGHVFASMYKWKKPNSLNVHQSSIFNHCWRLMLDVSGPKEEVWWKNQNLKISSDCRFNMWQFYKIGWWTITCPESRRRRWRSRSWPPCSLGTVLCVFLAW
jgi:hypothetical protein